MGAQPTNEELADAYYKWLGIPKSEQPANAYRLLGIALFEPNGDVIQAAADRQMAHVRTYQTGKHGAISQQMLNELAAAKLSLLRPEKRAQYDQALRQQLSPAPVPVPQRAPIPLRIPESAPPIVAPRSNIPGSNPFEAITAMDRAATFGTDSPGFATRKPAAATATFIRRAKSPGITIAIGIAAVGVAAVAVAIAVVSNAPQDDPHAIPPTTIVAHDERPNSKSYQEPTPAQPPSREPNDRSREFDVPILPDVSKRGELPGQQTPPEPMIPSPGSAQAPQPPSNQAGNLPIVNKPALVLPADHVGAEQLDLASGTHFNIATIFHIDIGAIRDAFEQLPKDHGVVYSKFSTGKFEYVGSELGGLLDGMVLVQNEKGEPAGFAVYSRGKLSGNLMAWRPDGTRLLFVQFLRGERNGFLCRFDKQGALCFVQEFRHDAPQWSYIIRDGGVAKAFSHVPKKAMDDKDLMAAASDADAATSWIQSAFGGIKKAASDYAEQQRRDLAARNSVAARARIIERNNERDSAHSAAISALRKWSGL